MPFRITGASKEWSVWNMGDIVAKMEKKKDGGWSVIVGLAIPLGGTDWIRKPDVNGDYASLLIADGLASLKR
jgi:hypothetical protein